MNIKVSRNFGLLLTFLFLANAVTGSGLSPIAATAAPDADDYGYALSVLTGSNNLAWIDVDSGTPGVDYHIVSFSSLNNGCSDAIPVGFNFKFYENTYPDLYISTEGHLTFGMCSFESYARSIPFPAHPNNLVAPLWANHNLNYGNAYYRVIGTQPNRVMTVEWEIFSDATRTLLVTNFEILLYEANSNIAFQYNVLEVPYFPDWYSVGIEDMNGINGIQYTSSLSVDDDLLFTRPSPSYRVNLIPRSQGGFINNGLGIYNLRVVNNGEQGVDTYNLQFQTTAPGWTAIPVDAMGQALVDTTGDLIPDTGPIPQGETKTIGVKVQAPSGSMAGAYTMIFCTAISTHLPSKTITANLQSAIASQFTQVYVDDWGIRLGQFWNENQIKWPIQSGYTGASLSVESISSNNYLVGWEYSVGIGEDGLLYEGLTRSKDDLLLHRGTILDAEMAEQYTDIRYRIVSRSAGAGVERVLTNGAQVIQEPDVIQADARSPAIAPVVDGKVAMVWNLYKKRSIPGSPHNSNIYLKVLNSSGELLTEHFNVTGDTTWWPTVHDYGFPNVAVTGDLRYVVCWIEQISTNVRCGSHTLSPSSIIMPLGPPGVVADPPADAGPLDLALTNLAGNRVLATYAEAYIASNSSIAYLILNSNSSVFQSRTLITNGYGSKPRAVQFPSQNILIAWVAEDGRIGYQYLDSGYNPIGSGASFLEKVNQRNAVNLSVTLDIHGRAVLTWLDGDDGDSLFYALLDSNGIVLTPPMVFISNTDSDPWYQTSAYGMGNAEYAGVYQTFLPLAHR